MAIQAFPTRLGEGVEVAVADSGPQVLLGVRDAFRRYFRRSGGEPVPVALVPQPPTVRYSGLALSDEETVERARRQAAELAGRLGDTYHFYVAVEGGLHGVTVEGDERYFVRSWTVIRGLGAEAWGANGSLEVPRMTPARETAGRLVDPPGKRRRGGLVSDLTGGVENRRVAATEATFHALCSLFYGRFDGHPFRGPGHD